MNEISIIIPTYQHASTIGLCLRSLLSQTISPKEIIVIDDGSTDRTKEVLKPFASSISYIFQENQGAPSARNAGAKVSTGKYLLFCDADVIAAPNMLESFVQALEQHPEASYAYCAFRWGTKRFQSKPFQPEALRRQNFIHTTSLIRQKDFPGFDPNLKRFQDWDLWLTLLERGCHGIALPEELFQVMDVQNRTNISTWLPSFLYHIPWNLIGWKPPAVQAYEDARSIIAKKHHLV